jgi:uncharacterized membrane protein
MKARLRAELPQLILIAGMFLLAAMRWSATPERVPVHFGLSGEADRIGGRFEGLLLLPLVALATYLLMRFAPRIDPGRANYERFWATYTIIRTVVIAFLAAMYLLMVRSIQAGSSDTATIAMMMGALFMLLGAFMGKIRPNWFVGIRTPWTLSSRISWTRTHRLGGWLFVAAGAVTVALAVLLPGAALLAGVAAILGAAITSFVYSYFVWRDDLNKIPPGGASPAED